LSILGIADLPQYQSPPPAYFSRAMVKAEGLPLLAIVKLSCPRKNDRKNMSERIRITKILNLLRIISIIDTVSSFGVFVKPDLNLIHNVKMSIFNWIEHDLTENVRDKPGRYRFVPSVGKLSLII